MKENKTQRVLTSLLMGMNCVNGLAPLATMSEVDMPKPMSPTKAQDEQIEYTPVNYQGLVSAIDETIFSTAEAFTQSVGSAAPCLVSSVSGEVVPGGGGSSVQYIVSGGTASDCTISYGGTQNVSDGGKTFGGLIIGGGVQSVYAGGVASVATISYGGRQNIGAGGIGVVTLMKDSNGTFGYQTISSGGSGYIATMSGGGQIVSSGAVGSVSAMSRGSHFIYSGGTGYITSMGVVHASVFSGGTGYITSNLYGMQEVYSGGTGYIEVNSAWQYVFDGGTGNGNKVLGGCQIVYSGGTASATTLDSGYHLIFSGGTATAETITNSGRQSVYGGLGIAINVENGGTQYIASGGSGSVTNMIDGIQCAGGYDYAWIPGNPLGGTGTIDNMTGGTQSIVSGGTGTVVAMSGGTQEIGGVDIYGNLVSGVGRISTLSGGTQLVGSMGSALDTTMIGGSQIVSSGGSALNTNVSGGVQDVLAGANLSNNLVAGSGVQNISGTPNTLSNNVIQSGGAQNIFTGAVVTNQAIGVGGTQNILPGGTAAINSTVVMGGTQNVSGVVNIAVGGTQVVSGITSVATGGSLVVEGTQTVTAGGTVLGIEVANGGSQIVNGGTALNALLQAGAKQTIRGGLVAGQEVPTGVTQQLFGGTVDGDNITGGTVELYNPSAAFNDVTMTDGLIRFGADGGNYNILGTFDFQGGTVDMVSNPDGHNPNPRTYETLTIANLQGNDGTFKLDIDLDSAVYASETTYGDKIVITNGTPGTHYIQVADKSLYTGTEITGDRKLLLVTDLSGVQNLNYVGKDLNNGGVWHTLPPQLFKEGNKWYLGYIMKEPSNDTTTYITDRQVAVYNQWTRIANDSLRKRLGDLRYNDAEDGVWARYNRGKLSGDNFNQSYNTYQVGIDKTNGNSTYGLAVEKQETSQSYGYGNGDGTMVAGNIYYTKYTDTGSYFDAIFKYGKLNSKYDTTGDFPDHADYDTRAYSLSLEYGKTNKYKNGYFFEPKIQLTYGNIGAETYTTDRGTLMEESAIKSLIGKLGFVAGRKLNDTSDYYFKAGMFREFRGERDVHLGAANGENMYRSEDYGDSWFEIGLGGNVQLAPKTHLYGDIEKSLGADIQKDWQFNVGVRWEF